MIGQALNFYQYAAKLINETNDQQFNNSTLRTVTEDTLAYLRNENDFKNYLLVEQPNGDWAKTILRQFFSALINIFYTSIYKTAKMKHFLPLQKNL